MKTKILHIDDDKFILNMFKIKFEVNGNFEVTSMSELSSNFLDKIADLAPELIISDYVMPGLDGIELLKAIKNDLRTKNIPFIFLTPDVFPKLIEESKKYGAVGIINPGVTHPQEVVDEVTKIMSQPNLPNNININHDRAELTAQIQKRNQTKYKIKKILKYTLGIVIIGVIILYFLIRTNVPKDDQFTPAEFNQMMLKIMETDEKNALEELQEDRIYHDCIRNSIAIGENADTYMSKCSYESSQRMRDKSLK